ncbi:hypothetical protein ACFVU3_27040 [Streptomyces sp. NPDC058052]|uniref:hypothetical protein n=1 Tax=Streptomyces sp. NPDC058052 TaxID=3346316 RepID=UPI0036F16621
MSPEVAMHMRRTLALLPLALLVVAGCSSGPSYEESADRCGKILLQRPDGETGKPRECEPLTQDDYVALVLFVESRQRGWADENGEIDWSELLGDLPSGSSTGG